MRTETAPSPDAPTAPKKRAKRKNPAPMYSKSDPKWMTGNQVTRLLSTNWRTFLVIVREAGIRTRQLPGEKHPKFCRADVERVAAESIRVGLPKTS